MKKTKYRLLNLALLFALSLSLCLLITFCTNGIYAKAAESNEQQKTYWKDTGEYDFADNRVNLSLTKEATLLSLFLTFTPEDFPEIDCLSVEDLSEPSVDWLRKKLNGEEAKEAPCFDAENFTRQLSLELKGNSKKNVVKAIRQLEKRKDILSVEPDYMFSLYQPKDSNWLAITTITFVAAALLIIAVILVVRIVLKYSSDKTSLKSKK